MSLPISAARARNCSSVNPVALHATAIMRVMKSASGITGFSVSCGMRSGFRSAFVLTTARAHSWHSSHAHGATCGRGSKFAIVSGSMGHGFAVIGLGGGASALAFDDMGAVDVIAPWPIRPCREVRNELRVGTLGFDLLGV